MSAINEQVSHYMFLDDVYYRVSFDRDLVFRFFTIFSLFEYALKQAGFAMTRSNGDEVQPDWLAFARDIHGKYSREASPELQVAIDYLLQNPPKKQVVNREGHIAFRRCDVSPGEIDTQKLSVYIRRIRNNLFHGGKFQYDWQRDNSLIKNALIILEVWAHCNQKVKLALQSVH